jgi:glutathionylspermidine synthase
LKWNELKEDTNKQLKELKENTNKQQIVLQENTNKLLEENGTMIQDTKKESNKDTQILKKE